jgi:F-type H+-transporting ATPase subunit b
MFSTTAYALSATALEADPATPAIDATHTETGVPATAEHDTFPPFDTSHYPSQLLWLAITFGIFYFLISKLVSPRLSSILATREGRIAGDLAEAKRMKDEANDAVAKYEQELAEARAKAQGIAGEARDAAKARIDGERTKLEANLAKKIADAEVSITAIKNQALGEVETVAQDTAGEIVRQLTGVNVTKADAASAVQAARG